MIRTPKKPVRKARKPRPKHDLAEQARVLGADSLLPLGKAPRKSEPERPTVPRYTDLSDLLPGEPYFLLKGRDPLGEMFNMSWCLFRRYMIAMKLVDDTPEEHTQIAAGFKNATEMQIFARDYAVKREHTATKFDDNGHAIERHGVKIPRGRKGS